MDAISLDEWELLPDHKSSFFLVEDKDYSNGGHGAVGGDEEAAAKKPLLLLPSQDAACVHDPDTEFMDIAALLTDPKRGELVSKVTEIPIYEAEDHEVESPDGSKEADQDEVLVEAEAPDDQLARKEEEAGVSRTGFSVGNLRVNGVGALCSFGVAAATFVIFLLGGKQQMRHQDHKIQRQMYGEDERIQQVVQHASRLNQTMSSVMGGASSARASISFGGYYQGF